MLARSFVSLMKSQLSNCWTAGCKPLEWNSIARHLPQKHCRKQALARQVETFVALLN
jgi:hypothetical protein